jgi:protein sidekick
MDNFMEVTDPIVRVDRGQAAILECPPIKSYPPPMVQWLTDDGTQLYDIKYASVAETHQLVVLSVSESDQKAYRSIEKENLIFFKFILREITNGFNVIL